MLMLILASGLLYFVLRSHVRNHGVDLVQRRASALHRALIRAGGQPHGEASELPELAWVRIGPSGELRDQNMAARQLPLILVWPALGGSPITQTCEERLITTYAVPWAGPEGGGVLRVALDHTEDLELMREIRGILLVSVLLGGLLATFYGRWIAQRSLAPLGSLTRETGSIDYRHLDVRLQEKDFPEEFRLLVVTLNASLGRLQTSFERLGRLGAELAHELRTPLQNLRVGLESLLLHPRDLETTRDGIGGALEEVARLASLIDQVLLLGRSEHPGAAISARELDLAVLLEAIAEPFCLSAEDKRVDIRVQVPAGLKLIADQMLVRRATSNLLANALRHAPEGGWIVVGAFATAHEVRIWVEDNGPGIPADWVGRLGTPFERGPRGDSSGEGFGLGLAIVKGIMNLHGGRMVLESTVGHGTKVSLSFPKPG